MKRNDIPRPILAKETIAIPELGGDVFVQGLLLKDQLRISTDAGFGRMADMLSSTVVDEEGEPIFSIEEWEVFGGQNQTAAFKLFDAASRLSGMVPEVDEKKDDAPS